MLRETIEFDTKLLMDNARTNTEQLLGDSHKDFTKYDASLRDIESVTGVSASTLSRLQNGEMPSMETFIQLCQKLDLQPGGFFKRVRWQGTLIE